MATAILSTTAQAKRRAQRKERAARRESMGHRLHPDRRQVGRARAQGGQDGH